MEKRNFQTTNKELSQVRKRVNEKIGFYIHLTVFICVNLFFNIWNWIEGGEYWAIFPLVFWGFGLGIHYLNVFDVFGMTEWKRKQILKQIEKQRKNSNKQ